MHAYGNTNPAEQYALNAMSLCTISPISFG